MPDKEAFFSLKNGEFVPAPHARSPWAPDMLHGRLLGGLAARAIEDEHGDPEFHFARLTVDLFRNSPLVPLSVETVRIREGRRIRVADATVRTAGHGAIARATAVLLRRGEQPEGEVSRTPTWDAPTPEEIGPQPPGAWTPPFDLWRLTSWTDPGPKRVWLRETFPLVEGETMSPFVRVALAGDFASPLANSGTAGLHFINADYTLTLSRLPLGEDIGLESNGHLSDDGVATAHCTVHDTSGPIGYCLVTAVANPGTRLGG
ncbi:acyl-CoA thioesterase domain-containing protein [Sphaerisporangium perillae]|uniref:acyl-CoA thioesterase domain-containing protein n=1 Tax=Sphaerisporangium perillae TaxID=2935860 RepID=UPI00200BD5BC|nr:acyl-CoA thioesterase domain-containing protein [Sphaerisporangium perillae]